MRLALRRPSDYAKPPVRFKIIYATVLVETIIFNCQYRFFHHIRNFLKPYDIAPFFTELTNQYVIRGVNAQWHFRIVAVIASISGRFGYAIVRANRTIRIRLVVSPVMTTAPPMAMRAASERFFGEGCSDCGRVLFRHEFSQYQSHTGL
jgi:hypothetical protein